VVAGVRRGRLDSPVSVAARSGTLTIEWTGGAVWMTGPASTVFEGEIDLQ
jgi:diaminopimelate epimerase